MQTHRHILDTFTTENIPTLDTAVFGALELCLETTLPAIHIPHDAHLLVVGSGNAYATGQILFRGCRTCFTNESHYKEALEEHNTYDYVVVVSASGGKHADDIAAYANKSGYEVALITANQHAEARQFVTGDHVYVFPKNREPYTYNTSTYLSMILGKTKEDPSQIMGHLEKKILPRLLRSFEIYDAFLFIIPSEFSAVSSMVRTKFDELFGPEVMGRIFTEEEVKHAKTVIPSPNELVISIGVRNDHYGLLKHRLEIPVYDDMDYGGMLSICYAIVGRIQAAHPPYFKNNLVSYTETASKIFGSEIKPIVE